MFQKLKKMKKLYKLLIVSGLIGSFLIVHQIGQQNQYDKKTWFSTEDLQVLEQFKNETLIFGISTGSELNFQYALEKLLWDEFQIDIDFVFYNNYEEAEIATINGEVDVLVNKKEIEEIEELKWISSPVTNTQFVITNHSRFIRDAIDLKGKKIGFLKRSVTSADFESLVGNNQFESYFYNSVTEALDALENQEIEAFITRREHVQYALIEREEMEIEFIFQNKILTARLATANDEVYEFLKIFQKIMNSSKMEILRDELEIIENKHFENLINKYIQEKHEKHIENQKTINVGVHDSSYPFSFFNEKSHPEGIYLEMLDLFYKSTGIPYRIQNSDAMTNFNQLIKELESDEIQLLLGISNELLDAEIERIGGIEIKDNIISIGKFGKDLERQNLSELKFAVISEEKVATEILGTASFTKFNNYDEAFTALYRQDVDIVIGRESVLAYYRDVKEMSLLTQTSHINRMSSHSIFGNKEGEGINAIMKDVKRLYNLRYFDNQDMKWNNQINNYQNRYNEIQKQRNQMFFMLLFLVVSGIVILSVIKERENRRLKEMNSRDSLTQLYNKRAYEEKCLELINQFSEDLGIFLFIDLNDFKKVNDIYGHQTGDKVLIEFARFLESFAETLPNSICFRIAGDEFGLFSIGYRSRKEIEDAIKRMQKNVEVQYTDDVQRLITIGYCTGGSLYNSDTIDFKNLKKFADLAMYKAKKNKKNGGVHVELFDMSLLYDHHQDALTSQLMDTILKMKDIYPVYQPIYTLDVEHVYGYEGLSRTNNPNIGNIMMLIQLAEKTNKIHELDLLMMERVLRGFKAEGKLFVNLAGQSVEYIEKYLDQLILIANEVNIPFEDIVIELSERTKWCEECILILKEYRKKYKFLLAIDDFGIGFANSNLIIEVEPDIVKIDRFFIQNIHENQHKYNLVKALIIMLKANNIEIACEGIEEIEELELLKILGSDYGQGYYLGKPE